MKAYLLFRDRDFDLEQALPDNQQELLQDLELPTLLHAMASKDEFLLDVTKKVVLSGVRNDVDTILYRQSILKDCLKNPLIARELYQIAIDAIEGEKKSYFYSHFTKYPSSLLNRSVEVLQGFVVMLKKLRSVADQHAGKFSSEGFTTLFTMLKRELDDEYLGRIGEHLRELKLRHGALISADLGKSNKGINYTLRKRQGPKQSWIESILAKKPPSFLIVIQERDDNGARALAELNDRGLNLTANALAQSCDHILSFFKMLRIELAFYMGCLNLYDQLAKMKEPVCFPAPVASQERKLSFRELYDVCLALTLKQKIVGNDLHADQKNLVIITGANQGGKSTFLRSIGLAQLMMQCGMFVSAQTFSANICDGLFTHYKREEDVSMESGKFDEELSRMSDIADMLSANSMVLFNESFAATNEREGSEIAREMVMVLVEKNIKVLFVTHLYKFAHDLYDQKLDTAIFLRAIRQADGKRTFRLMEGEPLETSYGVDLYNKVFGTEI